MTSPAEIAEPLEGITDAIQAAEEWLDHARAHRNWPEVDRYRIYTLGDAVTLKAKLQALK